ncbi:MAG: hypothetical protein LBS90_02505 [Oscillospiraceae bacterium]|jgi:uncharacterized protein|nr:hypothetical protein [Oscillospiraceae bacterium]
MNLDAIAQIARARLADARSHAWKERGNKYTHGRRVAKLALTLRRGLFPDDASGDEVLTVAAWFHDICNGAENHCELGANETRLLLADAVSPPELDEICAIIAVHDERGLAGLSAAARLHQDADILDHAGIDFLRVHFLAGIEYDETIDESLDWLRGNYLPWETKARGELHFEPSREIFDEKSAFMRGVIERMNGEYDFS